MTANNVRMLGKLQILVFNGWKALSRLSSWDSRAMAIAKMTLFFFISSSRPCSEKSTLLLRAAALSSSSSKLV